MSIKHSWSGDPHAEWALEGQPDTEPEPEPTMCMDCANYMPLAGNEDIGVCDRQVGGWARSWRREHMDAGWSEAVADTAIWIASNGIISADGWCDEFEEE